MALTQLTINLRYALMSLSLSQKLDETMTTPHRLLLSFCNTDEVFVVASQQPGKVGKAYLYGLTNGRSSAGCWAPRWERWQAGFCPRA